MDGGGGDDIDASDDDNDDDGGDAHRPGIHEGREVWCAVRERVAAAHRSHRGGSGNRCVPVLGRPPGTRGWKGAEGLLGT